MVKELGGLPLALEVIGSSLYRMEKSEWEETLKKLRDHVLDVPKVLKILKASYDGLSYYEQQIFLDIACFFNGMDKNTACLIWEQREFFPKKGINVLYQKSMVKIGNNNELKMHDLLIDLGSWLGFFTMLAHQVQCQGTDQVEGLCIDFRSSSSSQPYLTSEGFTKMTELRLLQDDYAEFAPDFVPSFSGLIWLRWKGCPRKFTLKKFHPVNLVVLDLSYSLITNYWMGWNHIKVAKNLKVLNLTGCRHLLKTPKLANWLLEVLILEKCEVLAKTDKSFNYLESLVRLNMRGCRYLRDLPYGIGGLENLVSLEKLILDNCRMERLQDLSNLRNLKHLNARKCRKLMEIQGLDHLESLETLDFGWCLSMERLPDLSNLRNSKHINARQYEKL
ncbi:disease resistance protein Roq1-like [Macadamia integrifolia]|uniref:disease resistance protein Roq1-like n=1 Tax=Macadamia integrifolia TaxID=60698 RepID=UPI001C4E86E1|nr:disease resistance protein Roq1-like [Macadamia integrifolia]